MIANIKEWFIIKHDEFMFKYGPERIKLARGRISAHDLAMKLGYESPYTDPDNYDVNWKPIHVRQKRD